MNLFTKTEIESQMQKTILWLPGGKGGGGINWEIGIDIYTLLYVKQTTNKDLLYSTGNSAQYSVMTLLSWKPSSPQSSSSQQGVILTPRGHLSMSGDPFDYHNWRELLASSGRRPGKLLNILQCPGKLPKIKNYPALNVNSAEVEKSCYRACSLPHVHCGPLTYDICLFNPHTFYLKVLIFTFK